MFSFRRKGRPSFFHRFISLFLVFSIFLCFNFRISRKDVKAVEPVSVGYGIYLLIGTLATMCGVVWSSIPDEAKEDFVIGGYQAIKDVATFDTRDNVMSLALNETVIDRFLHYVYDKENSPVVITGEPTVVSPSSAGVISLSLTAPDTTTIDGSQTCFKVLGTLTVLKTVDYGYDDPVIKVCGEYANLPHCYHTTPGTYYLTTYTMPYGNLKGYNAFYLFSNNLDGVLVDGYEKPGVSITAERDAKYGKVNHEFNFSYDVGSDGVLGNYIGYGVSKTVYFPSSLTSLRGIEDYKKDWANSDIAKQGIEVDGSQTSVDIATPIDDVSGLGSVSFPDSIEGDLPSGVTVKTGIENGVLDKAPDVSEDETLEHKGILQKILDWIRSLFLSLFDFLDGLLDKLIDLLRSLLVSLFVPSISLAQTKELIMQRLSLPIFSAPNDTLNKEPFTFTFKLGSYENIDEAEIVVTLDQPWFVVIRELILGYLCYLAVLFAYKKISSLHGSD